MPKKLALVVEDEKDVRTLFTMILEDAGFLTIAANSVDSALQVLKNRVPDVVTLDLGLPGGSGRDVLEAIRSDPRLSRTRVVVVTALAERTDDLRDQADLVLMKPIGFTQLRELVLRLAGEEEKKAEKLALVVEDTGDLLAMFSTALERAGYQTRRTASISTALKILKVQTPDVVVLDLILPDGSGQDVLQMIRGEPRLDKTKVILVTAFPERIGTLSELADLVMIKPIGFKQLRDLAMRLAQEKPVG